MRNSANALRSSVDVGGVMMRRNRDLMGGLEGWDQGSRAKDDRGGAAGAQSALVGGQGSVPSCFITMRGSGVATLKQKEQGQRLFVKVVGGDGAQSALVGGQGIST